MRKIVTLFSALLILTSCNSVKRNQKFVAQGNYNRAIELAVKKLHKDQNSTKADQHIVLLEDAFAKAATRDLETIKYLKKDPNPANARKIYHAYADLTVRQRLIKPLLPLYSQTLGRNARFKMVDYSDALIAAKNNYADYLHSEGIKYLDRNTIPDAREAYTYFCELKDLQPNYLQVEELMQEAHFLGTDFVFVSLNNRSGQVIPYRLERELLDFNTYGLDDFWTEYHSQRENGIEYNFGIVLNFREIGISPERISEREERRTKRIKTGWEYKTDTNGNIVKDKDGDPIKIDIYETVSAIVTITEQHKAVFVGGQVVYRDLLANRNINSYPLSTEFIFENVFANYRGDERALSDDDLALVRNKYIPFPYGQDMLFDAGEEIKSRLKEILRNHNIR